MKRNLALFLISALLVFSLTACGCTATPQSSDNADNAQSEPQSGNTDSQDDSTGSQSSSQNGNQNQGDSVIGGDQGSNNSSPESPLEEGVNDITDGIDNAVDDITGQTKPSTDDGGVSFDQMLNNGKVDG